MEPNNKGLCFRCEHRASYLEMNYRPRFECGIVESSVMGCYMFQPVKPICIKPREGDNRPMSLNYYSSRVERTEFQPLIELASKEELASENIVGGILVYWKPKEE